MAHYLRDLLDRTAGVEIPIPAEIENALAHPRLLIVGGPGSGKTAFLRQVAFLLSCGLLDVRFDCLLLPVLVDASELERPAGLLEFLELRNRESGWRVPDGFFAERLSSGAALVLVDGLSEAPSSLRVIEDAVRSYSHCRFIVTARPGVAPLAGFQTITVGPLLKSSFTCPSSS